MKTALETIGAVLVISIIAAMIFICVAGAMDALYHFTRL